MKLFTFGKNYTTSAALERLGVCVESRADASEWCWRGEAGPIITLHHDSPEPPSGIGSVHGANMQLDLDEMAARFNRKARSPLQTARQRRWENMLVECAERGCNVTVLLMNWRRGKDGRFSQTQLMYPESAWLVSAQWLERQKRIVWLREQKPTGTLDLGEWDSASCPDPDWQPAPVDCIDPPHCQECGKILVDDAAYLAHSYECTQENPDA